MFHATIMIFGTLAACTALTLAFLSQRYWFSQAWKFAGRIRQPSWRRVAHGLVIASLGVLLVVAIRGIALNFTGRIVRSEWWSAFPGLWLTSSTFAYLFVQSIVAVDWVWRRLRPTPGTTSQAPQKLAVQMETIDDSRRHFFHTAGVLAGAVPFVSAVYGFASERFRFEVRGVEIPVANLPAGLDGLKITQISDIHISSYMPVQEVRRAVGMANELRGDLTVVTGDFLTSRNDPLEDCIAALSRLRAPLGVWGCNGNHEIYAGAEAAAAAYFAQYGMKLLRQENVEVKWRGTPFNLIGVDYQRQRNDDGARAPMLTGVDRLVRRDVPNILLSHNPNSFPRAAELGIELSLAGHTHGGQVRVEILDHRWNPARFLTPYVAGLYQRPLFTPEHVRDAQAALNPAHALPSAIYVNRGLGTIGAPIRLGVPPEISLITLRRA